MSTQREVEDLNKKGESKKEAERESLRQARGHGHVPCKQERGESLVPSALTGL